MRATRIPTTGSSRPVEWSGPANPAPDDCADLIRRRINSLSSPLRQSGHATGKHRRISNKSGAAIRAGIQSVARGQIEAAHALRLSPVDTYRYIILPQAIRRMLPVLLTQTIVLF